MRCVELQGLFDEPGQLQQLLDQLALAGRARRAVLGERDDQHAERGQLRGERLGRGHADFRAGAGQQHQIRIRAPSSFRRRCRS